MTSNVTAVVTAMTDPERPWTGEGLSSILTQTVLPDDVIILVERRNSWIEADVEACAKRGLPAERVHVHRLPLAPPGAVRNEGVNRARTKWVAFLDGDDIWMPRRLERQLAAAARKPEASFVAGDFVFINAQGRPFAYSNGSNPTPSSWLVDSGFMRHHPFRPELAPGEEDFYWLIDTKPSSVRIRVPEILVGYRIRGLSVSSLNFGQTRQRRLREAMARASRFAFLRYPMLGLTYLRYWIRRKNTYNV